SFDLRHRPRASGGLRPIRRGTTALSPHRAGDRRYGGHLACRRHLCAGQGPHRLRGGGAAAHARRAAGADPLRLRAEQPVPRSIPLRSSPWCGRGGAVRRLARVLVRPSGRAADDGGRAARHPAPELSARLRRCAGLEDIEVRRADPVARPGTGTGVGVVTAWDPALFAEAQQLAEAHGRRFVEWPPEATPDAFAEEIRDVASLTVFVSVRQMTYDLLHSLILLSVRLELPLGLVPCAPKSQIPLTAPPSAPIEALRQRSLLYSYFFAGHGIPGVPDIHGRPDWEAFLEEAERGAEVMVLHTHGNGADAPISEAV